ncbi:hypothetical protein JL193_00910 [Polaribacter batillariae]|uniref:Uncharacterized protein n=1 Tax=Polaribacter batillariae TaxID=2808900 RepID=A0ABX7SUR5_9FLAO|nr:hypothetical protein [Polaribacter batillariae]QTD37901.1 hypothetical protein JL193_00910 [Polaribacter batillariae]
MSVFLVTIGVIGIIAGIFLAVSGNKTTGISGSIASAGITIKGIRDIIKIKK